MRKPGFYIVAIFIAIGCKEENKYRWTEIDINVSSMTAEPIPDSIAFKVHGHRETLPGSLNSKGENAINDFIINGHYQGGFLAKTSLRWEYDLILEESLQDSFFILPDIPTYIALKKRTKNTFDLQLGKKYPLTIKSYLSACTGVADRIKVLLKHKVYQPELDISYNSEDWYSGSAYINLDGCDTNTRNYYYPAGIYEVGVKLIVQGEETGYYHFEYAIAPASANLLELYY